MKANNQEQQQLQTLKDAANAAITEAEKAAYAYFCACDVGRERERAHEVYMNIFLSRRIG